MTNTDTRVEHTPGPWMAFVEDGRTFVGTVGDKPPLLVAEVWNDADAQLFLAAPDLLAALEDLHQMAKALSRGEDVALGRKVAALGHAESAIRRAQGEEQ